MLKKILITCLVTLTTIFTVGILTPTSVFADDAAFPGRDGTDCNFFLGFTTWDCDVSIKDEDSLKTGIWQIAANVASDIAVAAAYLVLGYVIYGGYLYSFSGGDPGKVATGKKTLVQAFIGLAIVMSANLIISTIRLVLLGQKGNLGNCIEIADDLSSISGDSCVNATSLVSSTISWFIGIAGVVSVIFIIYGGISYITSSGDPGKLKKAKDMILYALIGLAIVALAGVITAFVANIIDKANQSANPTGLINETFISKEVHDSKIN